MPDRHLLTAKIRSYLQALSPRAVQTLLRGLEGARARGSDDPHLDLILDACLSTVRPDTGIVLDAEPRKINRLRLELGSSTQDRNNP